MNTLAVDLDRACVACSALTSSMVNGTPLCADCDTAENRIVIDIFTEGVAPTMTTQEIATRNAIIESSEDAEPTYNVYEICMGAVEWEEGFNRWDEAQNAFRNRCNHVYSEGLNDYGPEAGDGIFLYDVFFGSMLDEWQYVD